MPIFINSAIKIGTKQIIIFLLWHILFQYHSFEIVFGNVGTYYDFVYMATRLGIPL